MRPDPFQKYVDKATPDTEKGRLDYHYKLNDDAIKQEQHARAHARSNSMRFLAVAGGRSPAAIIERAIAGEIAGRGRELVKEGWYRGFTETVRAISLGHSGW